MVSFLVFEAKVPGTLRIKLLLNPPDVSGRFSLNQRRLWHLTVSEKDQLLLDKTIKSFQEYFNTKNWLERLSYFDGEEQMLIVKDEDLREACNFFVECYSHYENYQSFLKIFLTEKLSKQVERTTIAQLPESTVKTAEAMYKTLTRPAGSVAIENSVSDESRPGDVDDVKLQRMTVKVTKSFNAKDVTVKVIDKFTLKCMTFNRHIKLGTAYNVHNMKKHRKRCVNLATGNESIATLFLTMTAVAEQTKSKAENMIKFCRTMDINDISLSHLIDKLQKVAEKPAYFNASLSKSMRDFVS